MILLVRLRTDARRLRTDASSCARQLQAFYSGRVHECACMKGQCFQLPAQRPASGQQRKTVQHLRCELDTHMQCAVCGSRSGVWNLAALGQVCAGGRDPHVPLPPPLAPGPVPGSCARELPSDFCWRTTLGGLHGVTRWCVLRLEKVQRAATGVSRQHASMSPEPSSKVLMCWLVLIRICT